MCYPPPQTQKRHKPAKYIPASGVVYRAPSFSPADALSCIDLPVNAALCSAQFTSPPSRPEGARRRTATKGEATIADNRRAVRGLCRSSADSARVTPLTASSALANPNEIHALRAPCGWLSFAPSLSRRNTHPRKPQAAKRACTTTSAEALIILIARVSVSSRAYPPALVRNASVINIPTSCD